MSSKTRDRSHTWNFGMKAPLESMFHLPLNTSEAGKFGFYRLYLTNHASDTDPTLFDNSEAPVLLESTSSSSNGNRQWRPFASFVTPDDSKSSTLTSSQSSNSISTMQSDGISSMNSSVSSNTNSSQIQPNHFAQSVPSLADIVKSAINIGHFGATLQQSRRSFSGTTLSSKDLNHLSPQSM
ncbi:unnamed protein product [Rotaria sordida]|uniref:Uncharacterized protein n=1 Tax=Rotaria sordida TaxID=392033 RepID=A0A819MAY0_9BILA|nr:unnamed protein product [Rotaria sordida]CAF0811066.1 unnamed protein product [Rotaria sordida]CAF3799513.1 unnamed protein product [Rotaria sordida]CAF3976703.1 unnamed protein product [Rotaria sordida]